MRTNQKYGRTRKNQEMKESTLQENSNCILTLQPECALLV